MENLRETLFHFFQMDPEIQAKWHIQAGLPLEDLIDYNLKTLDGANMELHRDGSKGYYCILHGVYPFAIINSFMVAPEFRKTSYTQELFKEARRRADFSACFSKNKPLVNFYSKHGTPFLTGDVFTVFSLKAEEQ